MRHLPLTVDTNGFFAIDKEMHKLVHHISLFSDSDGNLQLKLKIGEILNFCNDRYNPTRSKSRPVL